MAEVQHRPEEGICLIPLHAKDGDVRAWAVIDEEDLHLVSGRRWSLNATGYATASNGRKHGRLMHRDILGLVRGDGRRVDHINHDGLDNRRANLRLATRSENMQNMRPRDWPRGVTRRTKRSWRAEAVIRGQRHTIGHFPSCSEAAAAVSAFRAAHMPFSPDARKAVALMAEVLHDPDGGLACLVHGNRVFGLAFQGPDAEEQAWDFISWLGDDPFQYSEAELDGEIYRWREDRLDEVTGRLKPSALVRSIG